MALYKINGDAVNYIYDVNGDDITTAYDVDGNNVFTQQIKVMSYNVGSWTWFGKNATSSNQEKYYALQNAIFQQEQADIAGLQEYYSRIGTYYAETMLDQYFQYLYCVDKQSNPTKAGRAIASKFALSNTSEVNFQTQSGEVRSYLIADVNIGGKTIKFLDAHLTWESPTVDAQVAELLDAVSNFEYWILTGDFNITFPDAQSSGYNLLVKPFLDEGYHVANGSTFGFINTYSNNEAGDDSDWRVIDNIMCSSNIDITDVYVNTEKMDNPTGDPIDHIPLIAEMTIN